MSSLQQILQAAVGPAFDIGRELPGAGMSRVFLAKEPALARDVVVKVLPPDLVSSLSLQRFTREVQVTARLQHPHILPVITAGGNDDLRFYITPFIRGESLRARLATTEPMSLVDALRIADQLLNAISFAHARGVIHRDVKPGNILLSEGHAILADFGIAAISDSAHPADHSDHATGSTLDSGRVYVAPEQPRDEHRDLFAAAVVIHEMVAGVPATAGVTATAITTMLRARHPRAAVADIRKLSTILSRALGVNASLRYRSANELRGALHSIGRAPRRQLLVGIGVGGVAVMLAFSMFALRPPELDRPALLLQSNDQRPVAPPPTTPTPAPPATSAGRTVTTTMRAGITAAPDAPAKPVAPMAPIDSATYLFRRGDIGGAGDLYRVAALDVNDSRAQLGVAVTAGFLNTPAEQEAARVAGERALAGKPALNAHDRAIAEGFIALADQRFPDACAAFERARGEQSSMESQFGLGECLLRDDAVVVDANGVPAFRSGLASAYKAYLAAARAAAPNPPSIIYRRLISTVPQSTADIRVGRAPDRRSYVGNWRIMGDTLGHVLRPGGVPTPVAPETMALNADAAKTGREMLRPVLLSWVAQSPGEPAAHEALSLLMESMGVIAEVGDDRVSALSEIAKARSLEENPTNALRMAVANARLMLRARQYGPLATLADSLLAAHADDSTAGAEALMTLAMLTGRIDRATGLLSRLSGMSGREVRGADGRPVEFPATVLRERASFIVRGSLGVCDAQVRAAPKRLVEVLEAAFPGGVPRGVEASFMERITLLALPCVGETIRSTMKEPSRSVVHWARAFNPGDTAFAGEFAARARARPMRVAGAEPGIDNVMLDAVVKLAMKDSAGALRELTLALDRIPLSGRGLLATEWAVGSTVRGMALAAELAAALGDQETARRWASAVVALWKKADPELQPQVARLRAIAKSTSTGPTPE
ncbi:MAG: serine/threonine-protein kinase [Gemmatimonadaceae bacterium]